MILPFIVLRESPSLQFLLHFTNAGWKKVLTTQTFQDSLFQGEQGFMWQGSFFAFIASRLPNEMLSLISHRPFDYIACAPVFTED